MVKKWCRQDQESILVCTEMLRMSDYRELAVCSYTGHGTMLASAQRAQEMDSAPAVPPPHSGGAALLLGHQLVCSRPPQAHLPQSCCLWGHMGPLVLPAPFPPHLLLETSPYQFVPCNSVLGNCSVP